MASRVIASLFRCDVENWGHYSIQGIITESMIPGAYRVRLYNQLLGNFIRETWSSDNGAYSFLYLDNKTRYVIAFDHTSPVKYAAIQDNVVAT